MLTLTFDDMLAVLLRIEGNFTPLDGGTKYGVTQETYDRWIEKRGIAPRPVSGIQMDEVKAIYAAEYWQPYRIGELRPDWGMLLFVQAPNLPFEKAARIVQAALCYLGVYDDVIDGVVATKTIQATFRTAKHAAAINGVPAMIGHYADDSRPGVQKGLLKRRLNLLAEEILRLDPAE